MWQSTASRPGCPATSRMQCNSETVPPCQPWFPGAAARGLPTISLPAASFPAAAQVLALALASALVPRPTRANPNSTYCWGDGQYGTLGSGRETAYSWPLPAPVNSSASFAAVSAGWLHACGLTQTGQAYCWVRGRTTGCADVLLVAWAYRWAPALPTGGQAGMQQEWSCPGLRPTLSPHPRAAHPATTRQGRGWEGELGTGEDGATASAPVPVATDLRWTQIAAGHEFTCGISGNRAFCWVGGRPWGGTAWHRRLPGGPCRRVRAQPCLVCCRAPPPPVHAPQTPVHAAPACANLLLRCPRDTGWTDSSAAATARARARRQKSRGIASTSKLLCEWTPPGGCTGACTGGFTCVPAPACTCMHPSLRCDSSPCGIPCHAVSQRKEPCLRAGYRRSGVLLGEGNVQSAARQRRRPSLQLQDRT